MEQRRIVRVLEAVATQPPGSLVDRLCSAAAACLHAPGVAISVAAAADGLLETVAASAAGRDGENLQSDLGEGPAYTAHRLGRPVLAADLRADGTWPAFAPAAVSLGLRSVFGFPLRSGAVRFGALTLYRHDAGELSDADHADALVFARVAMDLLLALQSGRDVDDLDQLFVAGSRNTAQVHQAAGMVAVQLAVTVGAALSVLRARAYSDGRTLSEVAADVVARRLRLGHDA